MGRKYSFGQPGAEVALRQIQSGGCPYATECRIQIRTAQSRYPTDSPKWHWKNKQRVLFLMKKHILEK